MASLVVLHCSSSICNTMPTNAGGQALEEEMVLRRPCDNMWAVLGEAVALPILPFEVKLCDRDVLSLKIESEGGSGRLAPATTAATAAAK